MDFFVLSINSFTVIFGLMVGSFLNCVIYRLSLPKFSLWKNLGGLKGRSYCPNCKHQLIWLDLLPVLSFLFLRGTCRYCRKKISIQYPVVEIATALIFVLILNFHGEVLNKPSLTTVANVLLSWYLASVFIVIFVYDLTHYLIPDNILLPTIVAVFLYRLLYVSFVWNYIFAVIIASGFFLCIFLISKGKWMGFGDVKLAVLLGLVLGFPNIVVGLFLSFFFGAIIGAGLMLFDKKRLKSEIPFAPFLIVGTGAAMVWGSKIITWYLSLMYH